MTPVFPHAPNNAAAVSAKVTVVFVVTPVNREYHHRSFCFYSGFAVYSCHELQNNVFRKGAGQFLVDFCGFAQRIGAPPQKKVPLHTKMYDRLHCGDNAANLILGRGRLLRLTPAPRFHVIM